MEKNEIKELISDNITNDASQNFNQQFFSKFDEKKQCVRQQYFPKDEAIFIGFIVSALIVMYFVFVQNPHSNLSDDPEFIDIYILFTVIMITVVFFISLNQFTFYIIKQKKEQ